jgi:uncharacterized protein YciI
VSQKYVLFYEPVDDFLPLAQANYPDHQKWFTTFAERGDLLMIGPFMDGSGEAMGIFRTREAIEEFVAGDPFVRNRVVASYRIREWNDPLIPNPAPS